MSDVGNTPTEVLCIGPNPYRILFVVALVMTLLLWICSVYMLFVSHHYENQKLSETQSKTGWRMGWTMFIFSVIGMASLLFMFFGVHTKIVHASGKFARFDPAKRA